ncbi:Hypothetical protein Mbov_0311 [Mycoplasmopsis bovis HB0801]|uniref:Uncharacterized protein n=1 Tax=Mycoplasmopsis bovis (strain ATCC 25523 / DSM 22781 / NCTC 10131 / PG45) TaxID=289397 RepID=A0A454AQP8_MYCBG|nr:hypothetical protein MBOVPG45_0544 [Mycoplasmopsis bovis PG45]AFM51679.1 Hypothetical protein Mbov_0311 [Mycoplasmopsis bovis HB0801]
MENCIKISLLESNTKFVDIFAKYLIFKTLLIFYISHKI